MSSPNQDIADTFRQLNWKRVNKQVGEKLFPGISCPLSVIHQKTGLDRMRVGEDEFKTILATVALPALQLQQNPQDGEGYFLSRNNELVIIGKMNLRKMTETWKVNFPGSSDFLSPERN